MVPRHLGRFMSCRVWIALVVLLLIAPVTGCSRDQATRAPDRSVPALTEAMRHENPWVRAETARLLGWSQHPDRDRHLNTLASDRTSLVQAAATAAQLQRGLLSASDVGRLRIEADASDSRIRLLRYYLGLASPPARRQLIESAVRDADPAFRAGALELAHEMNIPISSTLLASARDDANPLVSSAAMRIMALRSPEESLQWVLTELRHERTERRVRALLALRMLNRAEFWPMLRQRLPQADQQERRAIELVLGHLGDPSVEDALRQNVLAGDETDVIHAIHAMAHIPTDRARQQPLVMLRDQRPAVRVAALRAAMLHSIPMTTLLELLSDRDPLIRQLALTYLANERPNELQEWIQRSVQDRTSPRSALTALLRLHQEIDLSPLISQSIPLLEVLSAHPDDILAELATRLLFEADDPGKAAAAVAQARGSTGAYLRAEWLLRQGTRNPTWEAELAESELLLHRVAAELITRRS